MTALEEEAEVANEPPRLSKAAKAAAFDYLCRALSLATSPPRTEEPDWVALVEQANRERVVTNLHVAFRERGWPANAPDDLMEYLALVYEANAGQNRAIRRQALELAAILREAGVAFVFLKGTNWLLEAGEDRLGERWLSDIDLAIAPADWQKALTAVAATGFRPVADPAIYERHFHHVPLARPGDQVTIELHQHLGWQRYLLTVDEVIAAAERDPASGNAPRCGIAHRFIFGSLHAQLQNMEYAAGTFSLRDLCDIQHLMAAHGAKLDWPGIAAFGRERGIEPYLAASLYLCRRLLGTDIPAPFAGNGAAERHAARCLMQHRGILRPRLTSYAVRLTSLLDSRRLAYEMDCEQAPWYVRQPKVALGRLESVWRRLVHGRRTPDSPFAVEGSSTEP